MGAQVIDVERAGGYPFSVAYCDFAVKNFSLILKDFNLVLE